jgi:acyl-CoA thioesterase FadM
MINYNKFVETLREDFFKGIKQLKKQNTENKLHTKLEAQVSLYRSPDIKSS